MRQQVVHTLKGIAIGVNAGMIMCTMVVSGMELRNTGNSQRLASAAFDSAREHDWAAHYTGLPAACAKKTTAEATMSRNIFTPVLAEQKPKFPFSINEIIYEPLAFTYMGFIERDAQQLTAQINSAEKTFFVKKGDMFNKVVVATIDKDNVLILNEQGEEIRLPIRQKVFTKKPYVMVTSTSTGIITKVNVGDEVEGYKVLDITKDAVVLSANSQTFTITK